MKTKIPLLNHLGLLFSFYNKLESKKMIFFLTFIIYSFSLSLTAQTTITRGNGLLVNIPDNNTSGATAIVPFNDIPANAILTNIEVSLGINHGLAGDLKMELVAPTGNTIVLVNRPARVFPDETVYDTSNFNNNFEINFSDVYTNDAKLMGSTISSGDVICEDDGICDYYPNDEACSRKTFADLTNEVNAGAGAQGNWKVIVSDLVGGDIGNFIVSGISLTYIVTEQTSISRGNGLLVNIPDNNASGATATVSFNDVPNSAILTNIGVSLGVNHVWSGDLKMKLIAPTGDEIVLVNRPARIFPDETVYVASDLNSNFEISFSDAFLNDPKLMGSTLLSSDIICRDDGICDYYPNDETCNRKTFSDLINEVNNGSGAQGNWQVTISDLSQNNIGNFIVSAISLSYVDSACNIDTDNDGIVDCEDDEVNSPCPNDVDANGVSNDSDSDGVPNCLTGFTPFITQWAVEADGTIEIPLNLNETYNYTVDWGNGDFEGNITGNVTHTYATAGTKTVKIYGDFPAIDFSNSTEANRSKIVNVTQWGDITWKSMEGAFYLCENLDVTANDAPNLSQVTSTKEMFSECSSLVGTSAFDNWDVSNVTDMFKMFYLASSFNQNIGNWNVSNVQNMGWMFRNTPFNQDIGNWNVSSVESMTSMFERSSFNQDIGNWNISEVLNMDFMFLEAASFDQDLGNWDISSVVTMFVMLEDTNLSTQNYDNTLIGWATDSSGSVDGTDDIPTDITLHASSTYCLSEEARTLLTTSVQDNGYGWTINDDNKDPLCDFNDFTPFITQWTVEAGGTIEIPINTNETYNYTVDWGDGTVQGNRTGNVTHTYSNAGTKTVKIYGDFPTINFLNSTEANRNKIVNVTQWGDIAWSSMQGAFSSCINLDVTAEDVPNLSEVTSTKEMFAQCSLLIGSSAFNNWNVSSVTDMAGMFGNSSFNQDIGNWNVSEVLKMDFMFFNVPFNQDLGDWDISSLDSASFMFFGSGLSTENYDALLIGWSTQNAGEATIPSAVEFRGGLYYCSGVSSRAFLINDKSWNISGDNLDPLCGFTPFITKWTVGADESIEIPINTNETYNYRVDWGDGTVQSNITGNVTHTYATAGTKTVKIYGDFPAIDFSNSTDANKNKIVEVTQWGDIAWESMVGAFFVCTNLDITADDVPDLSQVTNTTQMFIGCSSLVGNSVFDNWNVSTIINMAGMFASSGFNQDIGNWNVSNVLNMPNMFTNTPFNQDISSWNVSKVIYMQNMFFDAASFDQDLGNWDISSVVNMNYMFSGANLSTENYDNTLIGWATDSSGSVDGTDDIPTNIPLRASSTYCLSEEQRQELIDTYGWIINDDNKDPLCDFNDFSPFITQWTVGAGESIEIPINSNETYNYTIDWGDGTVQGNRTGNVTHTYSDAGTKTVKIYGDFPAIDFSNSTQANRNKLLTVEQWGDVIWASMETAFKDCSNLNITNAGIDTPNLSEVTMLSGMFRNCSAFNYNIGNWDVSGVTDMSFMFYNAVSFNQDLGSWNVANVENMTFMFAFNSAFNQDLGNWNVSKVENIGGMFAYSSAFNQDISNWDVAAVTNMTGMFLNAASFDQDLGNWDISSVANMGSMLEGAANLSTQNYDNTLIGWATLDLGETQIPTNKTFDASSTYCNSETERQELIDTYGWTINDDDRDLECVDDCTDTDNDGICDEDDQEINSPCPLDVDANGVSNDDDGDGIANCEDTCDNTVDTDNDGIADCVDQEINSPCPLDVDANGVSNDADGDGIANCEDTCDNTVDTDNDGIADCDDQEINSPCPLDVDANGVSNDNDGDGIANCEDDCDNKIDTDGDGIADCDDQEINSPCPFDVDANGVSNDDDGDGIANCEEDVCSDQTANFYNNMLITPYYVDVSYSVLLLPENSSDISFSIYSINQKKTRNWRRNYIEEVSVYYQDGTGTWYWFNTYKGDEVSSASISITGEVRGLIVSLQDGDYNGYTTSNMRINFSEVTYCGDSNKSSSYQGEMNNDDTIVPEDIISQINNVDLDGIKLYPNPASDVVYLKGDASKLTRIEVFNINGQRVLVQKHALDKIDISSLESSVYIVKLYTANSSKNIRLIKK
ncbi:transmembrane protein, putative [Flavobacteriales bacterium ALC-1]|nr:transmembrane protein, putative [Flavobacteriales bacterium ALC-1]